MRLQHFATFEHRKKSVVSLYVPTNEFIKFHSSFCVGKHIRYQKTLWNHWEDLKQDFTRIPGHFSPARKDLLSLVTAWVPVCHLEIRLLNYFTSDLSNIKRSITAGRILLAKYDSIVTEAPVTCISKMNIRYITVLEIYVLEIFCFVVTHLYQHINIHIMRERD